MKSLIGFIIIIFTFSFNGCMHEPIIKESDDRLMGQALKDSHSCEPSKVTYYLSIQPILEKNCIQCHGNNLGYGGHRLHNYKLVKESIASGRFMGTITWDIGYSKMPLDLPQLDTCDILIIKRWIETGASEY